MLIELIQIQIFRFSRFHVNKLRTVNKSQKKNVKQKKIRSLVDPFPVRNLVKTVVWSAF